MFPSPGAGTVHAKISPAGRLASVRAPSTVQPYYHSRLGNGGNEALAEGGLLDLPWGMAHIDDQHIDKRRIQMGDSGPSSRKSTNPGPWDTGPTDRGSAWIWPAWREELSSKYSQIWLAAA
jgi:hypothetical protein